MSIFSPSVPIYLCMEREEERKRREKERENGKNKPNIRLKYLNGEYNDI